ncbi:hypothetical protein Tco_1280592, partial [Tanacetum coccineum]
MSYPPMRKLGIANVDKEGCQSVRIMLLEGREYVYLGEFTLR